MIRWFLGFLMLFAIGGAVAGVITYLRIQPSAPVATDSGPMNAKTIAFIELEPVNVPIPRLDDAEETRTYIFVLEANRDAQLAVLEKRLKLRDTYTKYLTALAERAGPENIENIPYLKGQLQSAANEVLGQNVIHGVLIRSVISNVSG